MNKVFDKFTIRRRDFMVKEDNMIEVIKMIQSVKTAGYLEKGMEIGNCGSAEESDLWFVYVELSDNQWGSLLQECKDKKYRLIIKDVPNRMYFEKI